MMLREPMIQNNKPSYSDVMKELDIEIISPICNSNLVNFQKSGKTGLKIQKLTGLEFNKNWLYFLRYREGYWYIKILPIISQNKENRRIYS